MKNVETRNLETNFNGVSGDDVLYRDVQLEDAEAERNEVVVPNYDDTMVRLVALRSTCV